MPVSQAANLDAEYYLHHSELQHRLAHNALKVQKLKKDANVFDIGCGDGRITAYIAEQTSQGSVIGIDVSAEMISFAKQTFPNKLFRNLEFKLEAIEGFKTDKKFDLIVSFSCLQWVRNPALAFKNISNFLSPNGRALLLTYPKESAYYHFLQEALTAFPEYEKCSAFHTMPDIEGYQALIRSNDFKVDLFEIRNLYTEHSSELELLSFIKGWVSSFVALPNGLLDEYLERCLVCCQKHLIKDVNEKLLLPYKEILIKLSK